MSRKQIYLDNNEIELLGGIESDEWASTLLADNEKTACQNYAKYTKSKELGIGYQNLIQTLVHNYATGKIKLEV